MLCTCCLPARWCAQPKCEYGKTTSLVSRATVMYGSARHLLSDHPLRYMPILMPMPLKEGVTLTLCPLNPHHQPMRLHRSMEIGHCQSMRHSQMMQPALLYHPHHRYSLSLPLHRAPLRALPSPLPCLSARAWWKVRCDSFMGAGVSITLYVLTALLSNAMGSVLRYCSPPSGCCGAGTR